MADFEDLNFSDEVRYSIEHTWISVSENTATIGISDYAQNQLGEIIYLELPSEGDTFDIDQVFGFVESVKTASDLYMPAAGKIVEINEALQDNPELVNLDPFGKGWLLKATIDDVAQLESLLDSKAYKSGIAA